jgi:hypothetical protein
MILYVKRQLFKLKMTKFVEVRDRTKQDKTDENQEKTKTSI